MSFRIMFPTAAFAAVLFGTLVAAPVQAQLDEMVARPISLDEAVETAQRNLPAAVQARGALRNASAQRRSAYGSYLPNLNLNAASGRTQGVQFFQGNLVPLGQNPWSYSNGLTANVELFDGGRRWQEVRRANAQTDAADAAEIETRYSISLQVKQQYFAVLAARESEAAARAQLEQAEAQFEASAARVAAGAATKSDSLRSIIQVGNAQLAILNAQNSLRAANAALTRLLGSEVTVTAQPSDTSDVPDELSLPPDSILERLALQGPQVVSAEASAIQAKAARSVARSQYLPTLTVAYNYGLNQAGTRFQANNLLLFGEQVPTRQTVFFNLSYPIFNGFTREQQQVTARVAQDNAEAQARDARFLARQQVTQQLLLLQTAAARVTVQLASIEAAEEDLRVQQQRYNLGASTVLDLLTSQTQLNEARTGLIQARLDARVAKAQLEALLGRNL